MPRRKVDPEQQLVEDFLRRRRIDDLVPRLPRFRKAEVRGRIRLRLKAALRGEAPLVSPFPEWREYETLAAAVTAGFESTQLLAEFDSHDRAQTEAEAS